MNHNTKIQARRSFIFTPGLKPEMFPKALKSGTDMVCIELEDGIAPQDKEIARNLAMKLFQQEQENDGVERILRINCFEKKPDDSICFFIIFVSMEIGRGSFFSP